MHSLAKAVHKVDLVANIPQQSDAILTVLIRIYMKFSLSVQHNPVIFGDTLSGMDAQETNGLQLN